MLFLMRGELVEARADPWSEARILEGLIVEFLESLLIVRVLYVL